MPKNAIDTVPAVSEHHSLDPELQRLDDICSGIQKLKRQQRRNAIFTFLGLMLPTGFIAHHIHEAARKKVLPKNVERIIHGATAALYMLFGQYVSSALNAPLQSKCDTLYRAVAEHWHSRPTLDTHDVLRKHWMSPPDFDTSFESGEEKRVLLRRNLLRFGVEAAQAIASVLVGGGR